MATVLYVKANPKSNDLSRTFRISENFISAYKKKNPQDTIITVDLYKENIKFLSAEEVSNHAGPDDPESAMIKYATQFAQADKYVIATPFWNLGIPSILKAYFDYVTVKGLSFKYTPEGPVGLLAGKKAVCIISRGGMYSHPPASEIELGERYVKTILSFFGIKDYSVIAADGTDIAGNDTGTIIAEASAKAEKIADSF